MKTFTLHIITPEKSSVYEDVLELNVPTKAGEIGILAKHTPLVSVLKPGGIKVRMKTESGKDQEKGLLAVSGGFIEVRKNGEVIVLADTAEEAEEIDLSRAEEARKRAEQAMKEKNTITETEYALFSSQLQKELARIKVAKEVGK